MPSVLSKRLMTALLLACVMGYKTNKPGYADAVEESTIKSVLTLNLARYSEWPASLFGSKQASINLCLLADDTVQQAFALLDTKAIGNKTLSVHNINESKRLENCQILFASEGSVNISQLNEQSYEQHILTIGESDDFLKKGGMVYMENSSGKINLHINLNALEKAQIQISSRVLKLATIYKP